MRYAALVVGIVLLLFGSLAAFPSLSPDGRFLGVFQVDPLQNLMHLLTGFVALIAGAGSKFGARMSLRVLGIFYAILAVIGFFTAGALLLGVMAHNRADAWLHLGIGLYSLFFGYVWSPSREPGVSQNVQRPV